MQLFLARAGASRARIWACVRGVLLVGLTTVLTVSVNAQYNYSLNYQTNTINVVSNWVSSSYYIVGSNTSGNALIINSGGSFTVTNTIDFTPTMMLGYEVGASNNVVVVNGGILTNCAYSYIGGYSGLGGSGNQLIISNGGQAYVQYQLYVSGNGESSNAVEANRLAQTVLSVSALQEDVRRRATALANRTRPRGGGAVASAGKIGRAHV